MSSQQQATDFLAAVSTPAGAGVSVGVPEPLEAIEPTDETHQGPARATPVWGMSDAVVWIDPEA